MQFGRSTVHAGRRVRKGFLRAGAGPGAVANPPQRANRLNPIQMRAVGGRAAGRYHRAGPGPGPARGPGGRRAAADGSARRPHVEQARAQLREYLAGRRTVFDVPVDLDGLPAFQRRVLAAACRAPFGTVVSYGTLARRVGHPRAARAVGNALAANPVPLLIPCHRVVRGDGTWGPYALGPALKTRLLTLECSVPARGRREARSIPFASVWAPDTDAEPSVDADRFLPPGHAQAPGHWAYPPAGWEGVPEDRLLVCGEGRRGRGRSCRSIRGRTARAASCRRRSTMKDGRPVFGGNLYSDLSEEALYYIGGILRHAKAFNAFTAADNHRLTAVSFYTAADNVKYTLKIYGRFERGKLEEELTSQSSVIEHSGLHTIDLPRSEALKVAAKTRFVLFLQPVMDEHVGEDWRILRVASGTDVMVDEIGEVFRVARPARRACRHSCTTLRHFRPRLHRGVTAAPERSGGD